MASKASETAANGNGRKVGNPGFLALMSFIFTVVVVTITAVWGYSRSDAAVSSKVEQHTDQISLLQDTHTNDVKELDREQRSVENRQAVVETEVKSMKRGMESVETKVDELRTRQAITETKLDRVEDDIEEIKVEQKETNTILLRMERRMIEEKSP